MINIVLTAAQNNVIVNTSIDISSPVFQKMRLHYAINSNAMYEY